MNDSENDQPNPSNKMGSAMQTMVLVRLSAELEVHRELLGNLLAKDPSILSGKSAQDYIRDKVAERINSMLGGVADIDHLTATLFSRILLPKKKPDGEPPV